MRASSIMAFIGLTLVFCFGIATLIIISRPCCDDHDDPDNPFMCLDRNIHPDSSCFWSGAGMQCCHKHKTGLIMGCTTTFFLLGSIFLFLYSYCTKRSRMVQQMQQRQLRRDNRLAHKAASFDNMFAGYPMGPEPMPQYGYGPQGSMTEMHMHGPHPLDHPEGPYGPPAGGPPVFYGPAPYGA